MTFEDVLAQYEQVKNTIRHNDNGDYDYDISDLKIILELSDQFKTSSTDKLEKKTIREVQDFLNSSWELKNATNGINYSEGLLLVEHHQFKRLENEVVPSGISISKSGYWIFGIDEIGFFTFRKEFLDWIVQFNKKTKMLPDKAIPSQEDGNQGYAIYIPYDKLSFLFRKYKEEIF